MKVSPCCLLVFFALAGCGDGGSADLYARERALPIECRGRNLELQEAKVLAERLLPTVPIEIEVVDAMVHNTRRDPITGITRLKLVRGSVTTQALAHELGHAAVFDAYKNTAPPGSPSTEKAVAVHGDEFVLAYKVFLEQLVSKACAEKL